MWKTLRRAGEPVGRGRVERLMRAHGIQGAKRRGKPCRTTTPAGSRSADTRLADTEALADAGILASVGSVSDALDNAMADSFVDTFKTELISDRVRRTRSQLGLAIVEYVAWFNTSRLHDALGDLSPAESEAGRAPRNQRSHQYPEDLSL